MIVKERNSGYRHNAAQGANPYLAYAKLLGLFYVKPRKAVGISDGATISDTAVIAGDVSIFPFSYISDRVSIGKGLLFILLFILGKTPQ